MLRGLTQVMFLDSAWAGAFFALALLTADWRYGACALGGAALGTGAARLLGAPMTGCGRAWRASTPA
ncbi:urea transporter [Streptomyces sp. NPDC052107]|uniref:urea transporter n=1 Tax=Streptomyces sp. NPDC052107 TaxID=3155632 RepID=UPI003412708D